MGLWQRLRHPNIVEYLGVLDLKHSDRLIFLAEYLQNVSIVQFMMLFSESMKMIAIPFLM